MTNKAFADQAAIVGMASSDYHALYHRPKSAAPVTELSLAVDVVREAIADAGLKKTDIDGLVLSSTGAQGGLSYSPLGFRLGMGNVRYMQIFPDGSRALPSLLAHTALAIKYGLAKNVVIVHSLAFRSAQYSFGSYSATTLYDDVYGMASPGAAYAMLWNRYAHLYGRRSDDLSDVALAFRRHATLNPRAIMKDRPIVREQYFEAPFIARPLRRLDYCLVNDGAVAFVMSAADRARDLPHRPVLISAVAQQASLREQYANEEFWFDPLQRMKADMLPPLGLGLDDIDTLQVYDNFSPIVIWALEGLGWAPRGEGLDWIRNGRIELGGELPVNTSGGMMSESYLQSWNLHAEMVAQLRGEAGPRQIPDCRRALYVGMSAVPGASLLARG